MCLSFQSSSHFKVYLNIVLLFLVYFSFVLFSPLNLNKFWRCWYKYAAGADGGGDVHFTLL